MRMKTILISRLIKTHIHFSCSFSSNADSPQGFQKYVMNNIYFRKYAKSKNGYFVLLRGRMKYEMGAVYYFFLRNSSAAELQQYPPLFVEIKKRTSSPKTGLTYFRRFKYAKVPKRTSWTKTDQNKEFPTCYQKTCWTTTRPISSNFRVFLLNIEAFEMI